MSDWIPSAFYISQGALVTLGYTVVAIFLGFWIGVLLSLCKLSSITILKKIAAFYSSIFRGTPLLVQLSLIYFGIPSLTGMHLSIFTAGVLSFSLNSGAYVSEIIRAGIQSVPKGQFEAAYSLGIKYPLFMKDIILPQALKNILPALMNEVVNLLKESAIISVIGGADLMRRAQIVAAEKYTYFEPILIAAIFYYIIVLIMNRFSKKLEMKLNRYASY